MAKESNKEQRAAGRRDQQGEERSRSRDTHGCENAEEV
jgi:hypothetical protein